MRRRRFVVETSWPDTVNGSGVDDRSADHRRNDVDHNTDDYDSRHHDDCRHHDCYQFQITSKANGWTWEMFARIPNDMRVVFRKDITNSPPGMAELVAQATRPPQGSIPSATPGRQAPTISATYTIEYKVSDKYALMTNCPGECTNPTKESGDAHCGIGYGPREESLFGPNQTLFACNLSTWGVGETKKNLPLLVGSQSGYKEAIVDQLVAELNAATPIVLIGFSATGGNCDVYINAEKNVVAHEPTGCTVNMIARR